MEKATIFEGMQRLTRCFVDCRGADGDLDATGVKLGLELSRSLGAGSWEGRPTQLLQVPGIGPVGMRKLVSQGVRTVLDLASRSDMDIERLLSHNPPYGKATSQVLAKFPRLTLEMNVMGQKHLYLGTQPAIEVNVRAILGCVNVNGGWWTRAAQGTPVPPRITFMAETVSSTLAFFWSGTLKKLSKNGIHELGFSVMLTGGEDVIGHFSCENVVGTIVAKKLGFNNPLPAPNRVLARVEEETLECSEYPSMFRIHGNGRPADSWQTSTVCWRTAGRMVTKRTPSPCLECSYPTVNGSVATAAPAVSPKRASRVPTSAAVKECRMRGRLSPRSKGLKRARLRQPRASTSARRPHHTSR